VAITPFLNYAAPHRITRRDVQRIVLMFLIEAAAIGMTWLWGLPVFYWPVSVLTNVDASGADIIREVMPYRIVPPEWVRAPDEFAVIEIWLWLETGARLLAIWGICGTAVVLLARRVRRDRALTE
jgi:hypothetical protein